MLRPIALDLHGERSLQLVEGERLLKVSHGTQICAVFLVFRILLSRDNKDQNRRRIAQGAKALAQFESGELRHHQVQKDCIWFVFQSQPESLFRVARADGFIGLGQTGPHQLESRFVVVYDQDFVHAYTSF